MEIVLLYVNYGLMKNLILFMPLLRKRPQKISTLSLEVEIFRTRRPSCLNDGKGLSPRLLCPLYPPDHTLHPVPKAA